MMQVEQNQVESFVEPFGRDEPFNRDEIIQTINSIGVETFEDFANQTRHLIRPVVDSGELAILYGFLNQHKELIQLNRKPLRKLIQSIIRRKKEIINMIQESNRAPQWLKEMNINMVEEFTTFAQTLEAPMEIDR